MTSKPVFDPTSVLCVGRQPQQDVFAAMLHEGETSPQALQLVFVRGIGGIGKTTLSRQLSNDLVTSQPDRTVLMLDCTSLPPRPALTSLLRVLAESAGDDDAAVPLLEVASALDTVAIAVRGAQAPTDSSEDDQASWKSLKGFALEALSSVSAAAVETTMFGQPVTSLHNAVLAGVRAMATAARSAREALHQVASRLKADGVIDDDQFAIAIDAERAILNALIEFAHQMSRDAGLALVWDKAESISTSIFRLNEYFMRIAVEVPLLVLYAGRVDQVVATDGSDIAIPKYLSALSATSVDFDLQPFDVKATAQLLRQMYQRRHGVQVPEPPSWIVAAVHQLAEGLPLWTALLIETLTAKKFDDWEHSAFTRRLRSLAGSRADVRSIVAQLMSELPLAGQAETLPLITALSIAPAGASNDQIAKAADLPDGPQLMGIAGRYSFMRHDRLHDTVQSVVRHYLATTPEGREAASQVAASLLEWHEKLKPGGSLLSDGDGQWREYLCEAVRLRCWRDVESGVHFAVESCVAGLAARAAWIAPVLREVAWFLSRVAVKRKTHELVVAISRASYPILIADVMVSEVGEFRVSSVRQKTAEAVYKSAAFTTSLGRSLDKLREFAEGGSINDDEAALALAVARAHWLCSNGFNDEVLGLLKANSAKLAKLPESAMLREVAAESLANAIQGAIAVLPNSGESALRSRRRLVDRSMELINLNPRVAARFAENNVRLLRDDGRLDEFVKRLLRLRNKVNGDVIFAGALAELLQESGRFEDASQVCFSTLAVHSDWLAGWDVAMHSLLASSKYNAAADAARRGVQAALGVSNSQLTEYGMSRKRRVFASAVLVLSCTNRLDDASQLVGSLSAETSKRYLAYSMFVHFLFLGQVDAAQKYLETVVAPPSTPEVYLAELGLLYARASINDNAEQYLAGAAQRTISVRGRAMELAIAECAHNAEWLSVNLLDTLRGRAVHPAEESSEEDPDARS